jgi:hypothetical protein
MTGMTPATPLPHQHAVVDEQRDVRVVELDLGHGAHVLARRDLGWVGVGGEGANSDTYRFNPPHLPQYKVSEKDGDIHSMLNVEAS